MSLSRITRALEAERHSLIRVGWISKIYILVDIICLALQVMGTVMQAYGDTGQKQNSIYYISGGLIFQLLMLIVFILLTSRIHHRLNLEPTSMSDDPSIRWRRVMWALYTASTLIFIRNLVRVLEFLQGIDSTIAKHEVYLYIFDASPMLIVVIILGAFHPGRLMRSARQVIRKKSREIETDILLTSEGHSVRQGL